MNYSIIAIAVSLVALVTSIVVFPFALKIAKHFGIVDNPNARKLQRLPVPVFGGVVVYSGILTGGLLLQALIPNTTLAWGLVAMTAMMIVGTWDDISDLPAKLRFLIEILLVVGFIIVTDVYVDDFYGLWGIHKMNPLVAIPFSVFLGVGIINTINLIDGVDGYSSGYGMMACVCFALAFRSVWSPIMVCMTLIMIAALLPFFLHNVFGKKSRMFIGDGGALMLGMMLVVLTFCAMSSKGRVSGLLDSGMCVAAYLSAVGSIPLFDTIRVMTMRILRGRSPFSPDKTHLHHLFVDMGFSHIGAALSILFINMIVILMWLLSWKLGFSFEVQMYVVFFWGILMTFGFYKFMKIQQNHGPKDENGVPQGTALWRIMCKLGSMSHREKNASWRFMQNLVDGPLLIGKR